MSSNAPDILNTFLGINPAAGTGVGSQPASNGTVENPGVFSDILGLLTNPTDLLGANNDAPTELDGRPSTQKNYGFELLNELSGPSLSVWMLGRPGEKAGQPFTNTIGENRLFAKAPTINPNTVAAAPDSDADVKIPAASQADQLAMLSALSPKIQQALSSDAIALTSGSYRILAADVTGSTLNLTLASSDQQQIQVTLPLDQLLTSATAPVAHSGRVPVGQTPINSRDLAAWFEKLNLTELRVETVDLRNTNATDSSPVKLTFVVNGRTETQPLQAVLPVQDIRAFRLQKVTTRPVSTPPDGGDSGPSSSGIELAMPLKPRNAVRISMIPRPIIKAAVLDDQSGVSAFGSADDKSGALSNNLSGQTIDVKSTAAQQDFTKVQYAPVRFTLPDKVAQTLAANGRSISLKIQPEHLGPARLSLHINSDGLTARVTVDSPLAQTTIEKSLDRLHDQLTQAGVKVDRLEVALSGGFTRDQLFHQQSQWHRPPMMQQPYAQSYNAIDPTVPVSAGPIRHEYLSSRGVNLFA